MRNHNTQSVIAGGISKKTTDNPPLLHNKSLSHRDADALWDFFDSRYFSETDD